MISPHWHRVCRSGDLLPDATVHADVNGVATCLVRNNGQVYALHDECTHAEVPPSEGEVSNGTIECWLHGSASTWQLAVVLNLAATEPASAVAAVSATNVCRSVVAPPPYTVGAATGSGAPRPLQMLGVPRLQRRLHSTSFRFS